MKKNNYVRISLAFAGFTREQLQSFAVLLLVCLKNNLLFPNLPVKYADLEALVGDLGLRDRVKLLGFVDDTVALFHAMDVFVLSSVREGMPNALLEALSMGVPAVGTRVGGVPAVITDGENGLLCAPHDVAALVHAMRRLLTDRGLRDRLARAGRQTIERRFTFAARATRELAIYEELLSTGPAAKT